MKDSKICVGCGKVIYNHPHWANQDYRPPSQWKKRKYCSTQCSANTRRLPKAVKAKNKALGNSAWVEKNKGWDLTHSKKCCNCGKAFYKRKHVGPTAWKRRKHCSLYCGGTAHKLPKQVVEKRLKQWISKNRGRLRKYAKERARVSRENLSDDYIKQLIRNVYRLKTSEIPITAIAVKKSILKIKRLIRAQSVTA